MCSTTYVGLANAYAINDMMFTYDLDADLSDLQYRLARERVEELITVGLLNSDEADTDAVMRQLVDLRKNAIPRWLDECVDFVENQQPTLVGLTCQFDQTIASVALARRIRKRLPSVTIVLGGYALEGPAAREVLRCFPYIDAICLGEGERAIVELARASIGERPLKGINNCLTESDTTPQTQPPVRAKGRLLALRDPIKRNPPLPMDDSPAPDFDDFFADVRELREVDQVELAVRSLPIEASRGCWWGQHHHCTFCGIDDETMQYRARSPEITMSILDALRRRYDILRFRFTDYILPQTYFSSLLPRLAEGEEKYRLECEIKSNLTSKHFALLKAAGFHRCQPGIESFSSSVLERMCKGVTGIRNIQTLVLGKTHDVKILYNILFDLPNDEVEDYELMVGIIPMLFHLDPPLGCQPVEITRFAPLQVDPKRFGIEEPGRGALYDVIFSPEFLQETEFDLESFASYFEPTYRNSSALQQNYALLVAQVRHWQDLHNTRAVQLLYSLGGEGITFHDSRETETPEVMTFGSSHATVYGNCAGEARSVDAIARATGMAPKRVSECLADLVNARVVINEGSSYLGIALPRTGPPSAPGPRPSP
jgi:ribosomal peptide maturation radical SAM protein 1